MIWATLRARSWRKWAAPHKEGLKEQPVAEQVDKLMLEHLKRSQASLDRIERRPELAD